ncbi:MAG: amidohydrolase family protein, partial [Promethearchaeota archaeon]
ARYRASNINVSRFTTRFPFSMKLIGYARCDPMEGEKAVNEVGYARQELGLRGLKLHPRSERWIDDIKSGKPLKVLVEAAKHSLPVIFDTRGRGSILDIAELIKSTRSVISQQNPALLPHFKVIIAHFAQGNIGDYEVYNALVQPNTYADLSMLHGAGAGNFFEDFRKWFKSNNKKRVDNRDWSEYLLYASDYPYFGDIHAQKLIKYILNKQFFDTGGSISDIRNIMGLNQLKLLPEYSLPQKTDSTSPLPSVLLSNALNQVANPNEIAIKAIAELLVTNKIDISRFCLQFKDSWSEISEDVFMNILKRTNNEKIPIILTTILKNQLTLIAPLNRGTTWNKFGYKYFNPKDRKFFTSLLKQNYLALEEKQAISCLNQIF